MHHQYVDVAFLSNRNYQKLLYQPKLKWKHQQHHFRNLIIVKGHNHNEYLLCHQFSRPEFYYTE